MKPEPDDFEQEVETLRTSAVFQKFLDERIAPKDCVPLEEIEAEIEREMGP